MEFRHLQEVLERYGEYLRERARQNILEDGSNASGDLVNSIEFQVESSNGVFEVSIELLDYWKYLNYDTKPHFPPMAAIEKWIQIKPVLPEVRNGVEPTVKQLAYLIARKISREGTEGTHFFDRAKEEALDKFILAIEYAVSEDLEEEVNTLLLPLQNIK